MDNENLIDMTQALKKQLGGPADINYFKLGGPVQAGEAPKGPFQFGQVTYYAEVVSVDSNRDVTIKVKDTRYFRAGDKVIISQNIGE